MKITDTSSTAAALKISEKAKLRSTTDIVGYRAQSDEGPLLMAMLRIVTELEQAGVDW